MLQTNFSACINPNYPVRQGAFDRIYSADEMRTLNPNFNEDDDNKKQMLGASAGQIKAFMPKPSFFKKLWNGLKSILKKSTEKPKNVTFDDLKDYGEKALDIYDAYNKVSNSPNVNPKNPENILVNYAA